MTTERVRVDGHGHERLDRLPDDVLHFGVESAHDRGDLHSVVGGWVHPTSQSGQPHDRWMVSFCANYLVIPEGALVVKAALLEEEHDFGAVVVLST
jgi:hypothetical protein